MTTPQPTDEELIEAVKAFNATRTPVRPQGSKKEAADALGRPRTTLSDWLKLAEERGLTLDPAISEAMKEVGTELVPSVVWVKTQGVSVMLRPPESGATDLRQVVTEAIEEALGDDRFQKPHGVERKRAELDEVRVDNSLLIIDVADIHFGKFSVFAETGFSYNRDAAIERTIIGVNHLLDRSKPFGVHRILFVLGDDVLHIDNAKNTTTSGTPQDTEGTIFQMFKDAFAAFTQAIEECAKVADVDLIHVPSNHDWVMGWALSQAIASWFKDHPHVHASPYNLSERHRKYYRFGSNLIGLSHGDGAKESSLYACMVTEARDHISECKNLYWLLHHVHHKVRKTSGLKTELREKDHTGLTVVSNGSQTTEGQQIEIEYVRSPSPPDGWHHRNGYLNRQAVECFLYHPHDGQIARLTEFF